MAGEEADEHEGSDDELGEGEDVGVGFYKDGGEVGVFKLRGDVVGEGVEFWNSDDAVDGEVDSHADSGEGVGECLVGCFHIGVSLGWI